MSENLLIELGTEELPPKALKSLGEAFAKQIEQLLTEAELDFSGIDYLAAPRRLAVKVTALQWQQADKLVEKRGPAVSAAFDADGQPTKAAQGWARGNGITVAEAQRLVTDKGEWLLHKAEVAGQDLSQLLPGIVKQALSKLPIPKPMRWADYDHSFIRPVHSLCVLYGSQVIDTVVAFGLTASNQAQGHRYHGQAHFTVTSADSYQAQCREQFVIADYQERMQSISAGLDAKAAELGLTADYDNALLEEIAALVEYPVILQATFEDRFLAVPKEALIYTMKDDQKYVPLLKQDGSLASTFLFVSNIASKDPQQVIQGNEKVVRPRLADAEFFYNTDKKERLESRLAKLDSVLFQKDLGTLKAKAERLSTLAGGIAKLLGSDTEKAARAGLLAKADLVSNMVMEFPDVQGAMGKYYALNDGEDALVAQAIYEQYLPRFAGDVLPQNAICAAVALADKIDTLVGIFGIGMLPKGDKDPFALRRAAIGVIRICMEKELDLDLQDLLQLSIDSYAGLLSNSETKQQVLDFVLSRFTALYQEQGVETNVINAVAVRKPSKPVDFAARISAVVAFKARPEADTLAAANKRVSNILAKNADQLTGAATIDNNLLQDEAEKALVTALQHIDSDYQTALAAKDYQGVMALLTTLAEPLDAFFAEVMVMADDPQVRQNRLALLAQLSAMFMATADISVLAQ